MTHSLTHAAEEGLHNDQSAAWKHCPPTVPEQSSAVLVIPVMEYESKKIQVALRDGFEEISRNRRAPLRKTPINRGSPRP
jgi:hypothetical protein